MECLVNVVKVRELLGRLGLRLVDEWDRPDQEHLRDVYERVVLDGKRTVEDWGGSLWLVYPPGWDVFARGIDPPHHEEFLTLDERLDIRMIDLYEVFSEHPDPLSPFPPRLRIIPPHVDLHSGEEGHRLVAETVLSELASG